MAMRHFFIGFAILIVAFAVAFQPSGARDQPIGTVPERAVIGDDDLPNGAPLQPSAAQANNKPVCFMGPANATRQCIFDTIPQCRAECRTKRLHQGRRGRVHFFRNPALRQERAQPAFLKVDSAAPESSVSRAH